MLSQGTFIDQTFIFFRRKSQKIISYICWNQLINELYLIFKAHPRPKIRWFKNKMEIIDNPKYKMSWGQGIIQLEIRRARLGDAGTYTGK